MSHSVTIRIDGTPLGKERPRFGKGRVYTPKTTVNYELQIKAAGRRAMTFAKLAMFTGPVSVEVIAYFPIPESWTDERRIMALDGLVLPTGKPDYDNLLKMLDGLNKVVWRDDAQVVRARIVKLYANVPRLIITACEVAS